MLLLVPPGRGRWNPIVLALQPGKHGPLPIEVHVGMRWVIGGKTFRVSKVMP